MRPTIIAALALAACSSALPAAPAADGGTSDVVTPPSDGGTSDVVTPPSDGGTSDVVTPSDAPRALPAERAIAGRAVVAWAGITNAEASWVEERLAAIPWRTGDREVGARRLMRARGDAPPRVDYEPPPEDRLLAVAAHPSGDWSAVVATARFEVDLVRGRGEVVRSRVALEDPELAGDRAAWSGDDAPLRPRLGVRSEDSARLAADGDDVVVSLTTAWDSAIVYRWRWTAAGWSRATRTLVAPASRLPVFIPDTASYDVFDAVLSPWSTHVCVGPDGAAHVAVWVDAARLTAINRAFGSDLALLRAGPPIPERPSDILLTRISRDGARVAARVVGTPDVDDEPYAIACDGARVAVAGRHRREPGRDNTELHALAVVVEAAGYARAAALSFDGDARAIAQAVALDPRGAVWIGGTEGWTQNPTGVSVGGEGRPFVLRWSGAEGDPPTRVAVARVRGHGELRALGLADGRLWLAGIEDGPVTHTWDADRAALRGDGWIRATAP